MAPIGCAALPSVCSINGATHVLSIVNMSDKPVTLKAGIPIAAVSSVTPPQTAMSTNTAAINHLPRNAKLQKVLQDLHFDVIKLDAVTKSKLRELIDEHLDVFAECDSDVGSTNVVFHEIDTGDSRPFDNLRAESLTVNSAKPLRRRLRNFSRTASLAPQRRRGPPPS